MTDVSGNLLDCNRFSEVVGSRVRSIEVVPGTERLWPQSHSALLRLDLDNEDRASMNLFLKKVIAGGMVEKSVRDLQRDLAGSRAEIRFYLEFADLLRSRGLPLLKAFLSEEHLPGLDLEGVPDSQLEGLLRQGGALLVLESADGYMQASPLNADQARQSLGALAKMHAAAWQDEHLLRAAADRLNPIAGYWSLHQRGLDEVRNMPDIWANYVDAFQHHDPDFFSRPEILGLARRLERVAPWVSKQVTVGPSDRFATLAHGDYKAMNTFLPGIGPDSGKEAVPFDFQWTGVGLGMVDVGMHLSHSVSPADLAGNGERELVEFYRDALVRALGRSAEPHVAKAVAAEYSPEVAWRHYRLGVLDWARMVLSVFLKGASPEKFAEKAENPNVGLVYRDVDASLAFARRVDAYLRDFEEEGAAQP